MKFDLITGFYGGIEPYDLRNQLEAILMSIKKSQMHVRLLSALCFNCGSRKKACYACRKLRYKGRSVIMSPVVLFTLTTCFMIRNLFTHWAITITTSLSLSHLTFPW